ncbi:MAG: SpoIID/LytB domain-containing protein [Pyrinomonadaceae bacterium]|nr:SpoIID/LytB domain-containing protein [Pyrinomonadaceae bacterium]
MNFRSFLLVFLVLFSFTNIFANYLFIEEPTIRVALTTNARSVSITTSDSQLISVSPDEQPKFLGIAKVTVSARAYRPPVFERYYFEIPAIATKDEADQLAKEVKEAINETAIVNIDAKTGNTYRVRIGQPKDSLEEASTYKDFLAEKGFEDVEIVTEKYEQPSQDALALSKQINSDSKSQVRSLILSNPANQGSSTGSVQPTGDLLNPNLREVIVNGGKLASFNSLKPVTISSTNERNIPVRFNGRAYRGKLELFVNGRGTLSVINVIKLEDYVRGVVPNELGFPALEAQKAQAVAARTYAVSKIGQFAAEGFDVFPTTQSQVYNGYGSETIMGNQAAAETRGIIALYDGKPIRAMYTSTCGGRTEDVKNIYTDFDAPYLKGVECAFEGHKYFEPMLVRSNREPANIKDDNYLELVRIISQFAANGFVINGNRFSDDWFQSSPTNAEITNWLNQLAGKFAKPYSQIQNNSIKNIEFARILASMNYSPESNDTLLSEADIAYQLSFADADKIPTEQRANLAVLFRDGWLSLYSDATFRPDEKMSRSRLIRLIYSIYAKKKWLPAMQNGIAKTTVDGRLVLRSGKGEKQMVLRPDVFLFRQFGDTYYQVKETALIGGETVYFQTNFAGEVTYLEVKPSTQTATPERTSPFTMWTTNLSSSAVQSRLSRYVRGIGTLYDVNIKRKGFSRRAIELEIIGSNGTFSLVGGKIRSALRLKEQLFVMNKRYDSNGHAVAYNFTGKGWGHGIGMCQYGAFGLAKQGYKYDQILKHYYSGIDLPRSY